MELGLCMQVWPGVTHFPDFLSKEGVKYWGQQLQAFHEMVPYDGLWIDMDEASNFCTGDVCHMPQGRLPQWHMPSLAVYFQEYFLKSMLSAAPEHSLQNSRSQI